MSVHVHARYRRYVGGKKKIKAIAVPCVGKYEHSGLQFVLAAVIVFSIFSVIE